MPSLGAVLATAKRRHRASELDDLGDGQEHPARPRHARALLGRGGAHRCLPAQPGTDECARRDDTVPGVVREEAACTLLTVRLNGRLARLNTV